MTSAGKLSGEVIKIELHSLGVGDGQDQGVGGARLGMYRSKDITPLVSNSARCGRTLADGSPDSAVGRLETEASFVLKAQPDPLIGFSLAHLPQRLKRFFGRRLVPQDWLPQGAAGAATGSTGAGVSRCANP